MYGFTGVAGMKKKITKGSRTAGSLLYGLSLVFLALGLVNLAWAVWPMPMDAVQIEIPAGALPGSPAGMEFSSQQDYTLTATWPRVLRSAEGGELAVHLEGTGASDTSNNDEEAQVVLAVPFFRELTLDPPGQIQSAVTPGQGLTLEWSLKGTEEGEYQGEVVVSLGFYDPNQDSLSAVPVAVLDMSTRVIALWGVGRGLVLWFGVVGILLWGVLFIMGRVAQEKNSLTR